MTSVLPPPRRSRPRIVLISMTIVAVAVISALLWLGWQQQSARQQHEQVLTTRLQGLEDSLKVLRSDQRANARALQDAASSNRVLRDEVLGLSQRNALLEQTVEQLSADTRQGLQVLRQEEAEVMLTNALLRLEYSHDLESARRLYALADGLIGQLEGSEQLNLRQALMQERTALEALGPDPRKALATQLEKVVTSLQKIQHDDILPDTDLTWWQRLLSPLVDIHPSLGDGVITTQQRQHALDALSLEVSLARASLERGDQTGWEQSLQRIDDWVVRLWPEGPGRQSHREQLAQLRQSPLSPSIPELGSTLRQMRQLRLGSSSP